MISEGFFFNDKWLFSYQAGSLLHFITVIYQYVRTMLAPSFTAFNGYLDFTAALDPSDFADVKRVSINQFSLITILCCSCAQTFSAIWFPSHMPHQTWARQFKTEQHLIYSEAFACCGLKTLVQTAYYLIYCNSLSISFCFVFRSFLLCIFVCAFVTTIKKT